MIVPLLKEAVGALWRGGALYRAYLGYPLLQAITLVL